MKTKMVRITERAFDELENLKKESDLDFSYTAYVSALILSAKQLGIKVLLKRGNDETPTKIK